MERYFDFMKGSLRNWLLVALAVALTALYGVIGLPPYKISTTIWKRRSPWVLI